MYGHAYTDVLIVNLCFFNDITQEWAFERAPAAVASPYIYVLYMHIFIYVCVFVYVYIYIYSMSPRRNFALLLHDIL